MRRVSLRFLSRIAVVATVLLGVLAAPAFGRIAVNPNGVNVNATGTTTVFLRFADDSGQSFTSRLGIWCGRLLPDNSCDPSTIFGRLPSRLDRGSTNSPTTIINDLMTIPYEVSRRAYVRAREGTSAADNTDFFYVREFQQGGQTIFVPVTCRLSAGTARTPLALTRVDVYGDEPLDPRVKLVRIDPQNYEDGVVRADVKFNGSGLLVGWWEVRVPSDPAIRDLDRFTAASLSEDDRQRQRTFRRVKAIRVQMPPSGSITIEGPRYKDLPMNTPGVYEVMMRIGVTREREAASTIDGSGGSRTLFSGAVAGFPLSTLQYWVGPGLEGVPTQGLGAQVVVRDIPGQSGQSVVVRWKAFPSEMALQVAMVDPGTGKEHTLVAPVARGQIVLPEDWTADGQAQRNGYTLTVLGRDRKPVGRPVDAKVFHGEE